MTASRAGTGSRTTTAPFGCYIAGHDEPLATEARALEREVFFETFGNSPELLRAEYGPFEDASAYIVVLDHRRDVVAGMIRLIMDRHGFLKSLADMEGEPWSASLPQVLADSGLDDLDLARTIDIATLAVAPDYRRAATSGLVSFALYQAVLPLCLHGGMDWTVTILDVVVLDLIQTTLQRPFHHFAGIEPKRYLDSPSSVPVYGHATGYVERLRADHPDLYRAYVERDGLDDAVSPADWERGGEIIASLTSRANVIDLTERADEPQAPAPGRASVLDGRPRG